MFNTNLSQFFTGNTGGPNPFGADGASVISLPELLGMRKGVDFGGNYGSSSLMEELEKNFRANWGQMAVGVIGIPIMFNVATKLLRKPVILPANRMLKNVGLDGVRV